MTSIGLVGLNYCGSTVINNLLGGLPGCLGAGETHWILDSANNKRENVDRCNECVELDCPVFSEKLLNKLKDEDVLLSGSWWKTIQEITGSKFVVSSDKRPRIYNKLGLPDKLIFVLKDPRAHIVSRYARSLGVMERRKYNDGSWAIGISEEELEYELRYWLNQTEIHISWALQSGKPMTAVSLESLIKSPENYLAKIAAWAGVEFDPLAINFWENDLHYIGGNHSIKRMGKDRVFYRNLKMDERWKNVLDQTQIRTIMNNIDVNYQLRRLEEYRLDQTEYFH